MHKTPTYVMQSIYLGFDIQRQKAQRTQLSTAQSLYMFK